MHFLAIVFWSALAVQSASADPLVFEFFSKLNSGLKTMTHDFGSLAQNTFDAAGYAFTSALDFLHSVIVGNIHIGIALGKSLSLGAEGVAISVLDSLQNFTIAFDSVITEQYYKVKSVIMKRLLERVHVTLDQIQESVRLLLEVAKIKSSELNDTLIEFRENIDEQLSEWKKEQLQKAENASANILLEAEKIIDIFIEGKTQEFETCIADISNKTETLYNTTITTIDKYAPTIDELVYKYENCTQIPSEDAKELSQCASEVRISLKDLRGLPFELYSLKRQFDKIIIDDITNKCLGITFSDMANEKLDIEDLVDELLLDNEDQSDDATDEPLEEDASQSLENNTMSDVLEE